MQAETALPSLLSALTRESWDCFIFDPSFGRDDAYRRIIDAIELLPIPVLLYAARIDPTVARRIVNASSRGCTGLVYHGFDDDPETFRRSILACREAQARVELVVELRGQMGQMPEPLRLRLLDAMFSGMSAQTVTRFADGISASRHTIERWTHRSGLRSPKHLLDSIRIARYRDYFTSRSSNPLALVRAGFESERNARECFRRIVNMPLASAIRTMSKRELAQCVASSIVDPSFGRAHRPRSDMLCSARLIRSSD